MMTAQIRFPLIAFVLLFSMLACSVLPNGLFSQPTSATPGTTPEPVTQTTVFPTQPSPGQAAATEPATALPTQSAAVQPTQPAASPQPVSPQPAAQPPAAERITFPPGSSSAAGMVTLPESGVKQYVLLASGGQTLTVQLFVSSGQPGLAIWGADGTVLISDHAGATQWSGTLPTTQDYYIGINNQGSGPASFTIQVTISPLNSPTQPPLPQPPAPAAGRIFFAPGSTLTTVVGKVAVSATDHYVLNAQAGQSLTIVMSFVTGQAILIIWGADGTVLVSDQVGAVEWSGQLPSTQDYFIDVGNVSPDTARYMMKITMPPLGK
jgi:hypothetical protein